MNDQRGTQIHEITVEPLGTPGGRGFFVSVCSCGDYRSGGQGSRRTAYRYGQAHAAAKAEQASEDYLVNHPRA